MHTGSNVGSNQRLPTRMRTYIVPLRVKLIFLSSCFKCNLGLVKHKTILLHLLNDINVLNTVEELPQVQYNYTAWYTMARASRIIRRS